MLTSKQRAFLRGLATGRNTLMQIGKGGITENVVAQINQLLEANELVKIHCLENTLVDARDILDEIAAVIPDCEPVSTIGRRVIIYRESKENKQIDLNRLCVIPKEDKKKTPPKTKIVARKPVKKAGEKSFGNTVSNPRGSRGGFGRKTSKRIKKG